MSLVSIHTLAYIEPHAQWHIYMNNFALKEVVEVPRMGLRALKYVHEATNLTHLHVEKPGDANRVFSLAFKTDAPDKTGVPHILEHTTLCGSEKFPVRDPFFKMLTRSLANFMNAMTAFDYTYYPFATTNKADYANLQQVYMDSVFAPLLKEQDFNQEGWRLEPAELTEPEKTPLIFKGVVYNEMKGQMSMPAYQFYMAWFMAMYPSMQYSAGDPMHIPDLKYEDLVQFHRNNYNPSNCFTFSYGDFPAEEAMLPLTEYLDRAGNHVSTSYVHRPIPEPVALTKTQAHKQFGPLDPMVDSARQHKVSLTWYVGEAADLTQMMVWRVLGLLLTDGHASPFYRSLIDSGIGPEFSVNTGFEETPSKLLFTVGLEGIEEAKVPAFKQAVFETLDKITSEGFPSERVDALLHQAELGDREVDANYGMNLLHKMVNRAFHPSGDFMKMVDNEHLLSAFKTKLAENPRLFQDELSQFVGRDKPYFQFEMAPSETFDADRAAAESKLLAEKLASMTDEDKSVAITKAQELERATQSKQDLEVLPSVKASDISRDIRKYPVTQSVLGNIPMVTRETGTQGISYVRLMRDLSSLPQDLVPYLPLYTEALTSVGTKTHGMAELEDLIKLNTGNLSVAPTVRSWGNVELSYGASALDTKLSQMYSLLTELITEPKLDNIGKLKVILDSSAANITNALSDTGHRYAISRAAAALNPHKAAGDQLSGFAFVKLVQQLSGKSESELETALVPKLEQIHALPWSFRTVGLTQTKALPVHETHTSHLNHLISGLGAQVAPAAPTVSELYTPSAQQKLSQLWPTVPHNTMVSLPSFQVSHVGGAVRGSPESLNHRDHAALQVLANLLTHKHLHTEIRERGGAYGGGAKYDALDGVFSMFSYRDPTPENTREVMRNAGKWAATHEFSERDVEEGKIGIFQSIDSPISPRNEITPSLGLRSTDAERQQRRENLLNVTPGDVQRVAAEFLAPNLEKESGNAICVIGPGETPANWTSISL